MFGQNGQSSGSLGNPSRPPFGSNELVQDVAENEAFAIITLGSSQIPTVTNVRSLGRDHRLSGFIAQQAPAQEPARFPRGRITGPVKFFGKLIAIWRLDLNDACALLGYELQDRQHVEEILAGSVTLRGKDTKDRIATLFRIHSLLSGLFRNVNVENDWLREPCEALGGRRPIELLQHGSMEELLTVRQLIEHSAGL